MSTQPTFNTTAAESSYKEERFIFYEVLKTVFSPLTASSQSAEASILAVHYTAAGIWGLGLHEFGVLEIHGSFPFTRS